MNKKWKKSAQRFFALFLCVAMLLPMFPQVVRAAGTTPGVVLGNGIAAGGSTSGTATTGTTKIVLKPEGGAALTRNGHYALVSGDLKYMMYHDPATYVNGSLLDSLDRDDDGGRADTFRVSGKNIYIDHSDRDAALWVVKQYGISTGQYIRANTKGSCSNSGVVSYVDNIAATYFGASNVLFGMELQKGMYSTTDNGIISGDNGSANNANQNGPYWYSDSNTDNRFLNWKSEGEMIQDQTVQASNGGANGDRLKYSIALRKASTTTEPGKYIIYFAAQFPRVPNTDANYADEVRVLYCDESGAWRVQRYRNEADDVRPGDAMPLSQLSSDLNSGKYDVCLYKYNTDTGSKTLTYSGYSTYNAVSGTTLATVVDTISENFFIYDPATNLPIPCSGTTAKVGCYYFDISALPSNNKTKSVNVYYVNDNKSTVQITTITVGVYQLGSSALSSTAGITSLNSAYKYEVFQATNDGNGTYVASNNKMTFTIGDLIVPVTLNMVFKDGSTQEHINTTAAVQTGSGIAADVRFGGTKIGDINMYVAGNTIAQQLPNYPDVGSVWVGKDSPTLQSDFSKNGQATIQLSATGVPSTSPVDLIVMLDLSSSMRYTMTDSSYYRSPYYGPENKLNVVGDNYEEDKKSAGTGDFAWSISEWETTRMYAMEQSLKKMIKALQATGADINVAMADFGDLDHFMFEDAALDTDSLNRLWHFFDSNKNGKLDNNGGFEFSNQLNYILGRDDYKLGLAYASGKRWVSQVFALDDWKYIDFTDLTIAGVGDTTIELDLSFAGAQNPTVYTGTALTNGTGRSEKLSNAFTDVNDLNSTAMNGIIEQIRITNSKMIGTNYDIGLEYAYKLAYERQQENIVNGEDRQIVIVFMSDGAAMQYNYFSGRSVTDAWSQYLIGETDQILTNYNGAGTVNDAYSWDLTDVKNNSTGAATADGIPDNYNNFHPEVQRALTLFHMHLANTSGAKGTLVDTDGNYCAGCSHYNGGTLDGQETGENFFTCLANQPWFKSKWNSKFSWTLFFELYFKNETSTSSIKDDLLGREDMVRVLTMPSGGSYEIVNRDEVNWTYSGQQYQTYSPYYYFYNTEGKNWWAEAIKGSVGGTFPVINKYAKGPITIASSPSNSKTYSNPISYNGEPGKIDKFSTGTGLALDGKDYISGFAGLGLPIYTVGFCLADENKISKEEATTVLKNISSGDGYYFPAANQPDLENALTQIVNSTTMSADRAYFVDTMGEKYDLVTSQTITVKKYNITNTTGGVPERGSVTETLEKITINSATSATSNQVSSDNIVEDGIIKGKYVYYNTNSSAKTVTFGSAGTISLPAESFLWEIGVMPDEIIVLEYKVELAGAMAGEYKINTDRDVYDTNKSAVLTYYDFLGNKITRDTVSPKFAYGDQNEIKVVIDYGIPVDIAVLNNDTYTPKYSDGNTGLADDTATAFSAKIVGVANIKDKTAANVSSTDFYGTAGVSGNDGKLTYTANGDTVTYDPTDKNMSMDTYEKFSVKIQRTGDSSRYYYCTVYVIPATTMYYEQDFVTFQYRILTNANTNTWSAAETQTQTIAGKWTIVPTDSDLRQADDRVGSANANEYGSDNVSGGYVAHKLDSLGTSTYITVNNSLGGIASFTFTGTGFDVISRTTAKTGSIIVSVYATDANGNKTGDPVQKYFVDTYYGYKLVNGEWVVDTSANDSLYQIPVMKINNLTYGQYYAEIMVAYNVWLDHKVPAEEKPTNTNGSYEFYLDAIRIYDPANDGIKDTTNVIKDAYLADGEAYPVYSEVRNMLISANDFNSYANTGNSEGTGVVFIDNTAADGLSKQYTISDYTNYGPNNEVYLAKGQAIAFNVTRDNGLKELQIAMKLAKGSSIPVTITGYVGSKAVTSKQLTISSATDLYEDITSLLNNTGVTTVLVQNASTTQNDASILSITNLKTTYTGAVTNGYAAEKIFALKTDAIKLVWDAMNAPENDNQPDQENPGTEGNPVSGDVEMNAVAMVLMSACVMLLAVLFFANIRKKSTK